MYQPGKFIRSTLQLFTHTHTHTHTTHTHNTHTQTHSHTQTHTHIHTIHLTDCIMQNEARKLNHQELVEEDKRMKLPPNHEAVQRRIQWETAEEEAKKVSI